MKNNKIKISVTILASILIFSTGCSRKNLENENSVSQDKLEKLPEHQKDDEINKELAELREIRKKSYKEDSMGSYSGTTKMKGDLIDIPVSDDEIEKIREVSENYVRNTLNIAEKSGLEGPTACIDNRMLKIYEDEDKGVAKGCDNENIWVDEYEYEQGKYKYLIIAKKDKDNHWKVIHDGLSYKE